MQHLLSEFENFVSSLCRHDAKLTKDFYKEDCIISTNDLLLSYRIVFAQNKLSRELRRHQAQSDPGSLPGDALQQFVDAKPLRRTAGPRCPQVHVNGLVGISVVGTRLLALQNYKNAQNPSGLRTLWTIVAVCCASTLSGQSLWWGACRYL